MGMGMGTAPSRRLRRRLPALAVVVALCGGPAATLADGPAAGALGIANTANAAGADVPPLPTGLLIPVEGVAAASLRATFDERRGAGRHEAIDIMAPRGTPVRAVGDGKLVKLFTSVRGGLTVYQFDPQANHAYYYAHLDAYAPGLKEGMPLKRGDAIGSVGSTGDAAPNAPHLHFAIFRLGPEKQWWKGTPIDPYPLLRQAPAATSAPAPR